MDEEHLGSAVPVDCRKCGKRFEIDYTWVGAPAPCPTCGNTNLVKAAPGSVYRTEYQRTFSDFMLLVTEPAYRPAMSKLLLSWGLHVGDAGDPELTFVDGRSADPLAVHLAIQRHPEKQRKLYQLSLSLWR